MIGNSRLEPFIAIEVHFKRCLATIDSSNIKGHTFLNVLEEYGKSFRAHIICEIIELEDKIKKGLE